MTRYFAILAIAMLSACSDQEMTRLDSPASTPSGEKARPNGIPTGYQLHDNKDARGRWTVRNAEIVEGAMWSFAADNGGIIPVSLADVNAAGKTLVDYLPGRRYLVNAYTRVRSEPGYGFAQYEGQVCFAEILDLDGYVIGFTITARGTYPEVELRYDRYLPGQNLGTQLHP